MTTDAKQVPPALSAEEWGKVLRPNAERGFPEEGETAEDIAQSLASRASYRCDMEDWPQTVALANAALPDDSPYKITRADATLVRDAHDELQALTQAAQNWWPIPQERIDALLALAAKLEALLPPE